MAETIVKIENLVKRYHELVAVDHFNLTVSKGEILGLLEIGRASCRERV